VQRSVARVLAFDNAAMSTHHALLFQARKLDGNRALIEMVKAVAWHER
jgi:hypothetical protein